MTLNLMLGVASGVLHPAQGCKILVINIVYVPPDPGPGAVSERVGSERSNAF